jgi:polysaccharide pyruvyl transferase WcaK-like protein
MFVLSSGLPTTNMKPTILVYGWYNQGNLGDELFKEAFRSLFLNYDFIFTDHITKASLKDVSAVFIGGGSFLFAPLKMESGAADLLQQKKLFYIGVGSETEIHPFHLELFKIAKLIAIRNNNNLELIKSINSNVMVIPDIVYSLQSSIASRQRQKKNVLVIPNMAVVPTWNDPHWKHASWNYFKSEFAQALDLLVDDGHTIKFLAMCQNSQTDDHAAAIEIVNHMNNRGRNYLLHNPSSDLGFITANLSQFDFIITQRFHGIVLSEMMRVPYVSIYHHDKLKHCQPGDGVFLSYYGVTKAELMKGFKTASEMKFSSTIPIESNIFEKLKESVISLVDDR